MSVEVIDVSAFDGSILPGELAIGEGERAEAQRYWANRLAENPRLFDGRVLLAETVDLSSGRLEARFREAPYSTFLWLRAGGAPGRELGNVFSAAAVVTSDGAVLLGRMAPHTATAGQMYFPAGTPDLEDVVGDTVDLEGSLARELMEETGLGAPLVRPTEKRFVVAHGFLYACIRRFDTDLDAEALARTVEANLAAEAEPELDRAVLVRSAEELTAMSPVYVHAAIAHLLKAAR
ncbi:NUDIX hydrolase [Hansschlegelia sp.]|uniref:NUDIX hydrolase n=1 Tax=Hansschlegelia sp. TaxID=2041892 RepID=UPI002BEBB500|nr:NUDIX hydrolase [Hansschlegelia sp.]HVI28292.1 NUDIX hydrolase [Hansschlegelia sp.]